MICERPWKAARRISPLLTSFTISSFTIYSFGGLLKCAADGQAEIVCVADDQFLFMFRRFVQAGAGVFVQQRMHLDAPAVAFRQRERAQGQGHFVFIRCARISLVDLVG